MNITQLTLLFNSEERKSNGLKLFFLTTCFFPSHNIQLLRSDKIRAYLWKVKFGGSREFSGVTKIPYILLSEVVTLCTQLLKPTENSRFIHFIVCKPQFF